MSRFTVPDVQALQHTAVRGGDLVMLGTVTDRQDTLGWKDRQDALVWVGSDDVHTVRLGARPDPGWRGWSSLLAHPEGGVVVVRDLEHAVYVAGPDAPLVALPIGGAELLAGVDPTPILHGGSAVSDEPRWQVVLSHARLLADLRYAAALTVDLTSGVARWEAAPWWLDPTEFPRDLGGKQDNDPHASIAATLLHRGTLHVCSVGSQSRRLYVYGADYFSCVRLTPDAHVADRVHEQSGWMSQPGKQGIDARFTADGTYAILTPAFRSGDWKGRQRILRLADGALLTPTAPRGLAKADILDHHPDRGWWLKLNNTATAVPTLVAP